MNERYEYRTFRIERGCWPRVTAAAHEIPSLFGLWRGEIGWHNDEAALLACEPEPNAFDGLPHVVSSTVERVVATVRPVEPVPPVTQGTYAHRWFELDEADWDEFLELSSTAWPAFEAAYDAEVIGFWKSLDAQAPAARVLLVTRYPSLEAWERSRALGSEDSRSKFIRRHELTKRTIVRIGALTSTNAPS